MKTWDEAVYEEKILLEPKCYLVVKLSNRLKFSSLIIKWIYFNTNLGSNKILGPLNCKYLNILNKKRCVSFEKLLNKFRVYKWKCETLNKETINKYIRHSDTPLFLLAYLLLKIFKKQSYYSIICFLL
ncbi:Uncharacterized protein FWK35_00008181 [Aphis craccivora]|uniref:Uncharacterized protein n=1 Tax=Aphis craccivora TaxID=307492 RepID=A0A6G0Z7U5_APHCR|nr:Uncharacterized protein FWK35_00008181 [Aphis craccivora]